MRPSFSPLRLRRTFLPPGFTLVELLISISIIAILAALLIPVIGIARDGAKKAQCVTNLRVWGNAIIRYASDNGGKVQWNDWQDISSTKRYYDTYLADSATLFYGKSRLATEYFRKCPATTWNGQGNSPVNYAMVRPVPNQANSSSYSLTQATQPSKFLMMADADDLIIDSASSFKALVGPICTVPGKIRHRGAVNMLFGDAHVESRNWSQLDGDSPEEQAYVQNILKLQP